MLPGTLGPQDFSVPTRTLRGRIAVAAMERLTDLLAEGEATVETALECGLDGEGRRTIAGRVQARLPMRCHRCLQVYDHVVDSSFHVVVVESGAEAEALPDELEPFISEGGAVSPHAVVEEELLLSLPVVALHDDRNACLPPAHAAGMTPERTSPFAALQGRLGGREED